MNRIDIDKYCEEHAFLPPEKDMIRLLASQDMPPDSPVMKKVMAYQSEELLLGLEMTIVHLEGWMEGATEGPAAKEMADRGGIYAKTLGKIQMMLTEQIAMMEETKNEQGLRLARSWGKLHVRDDDPDDDSISAKVEGFVGYELGETIYIEMDREIAQERIDDYHAKRMFKGGNGHANPSAPGVKALLMVKCTACDETLRQDKVSGHRCKTQKEED